MVVSWLRGPFEQPFIEELRRNDLAALQKILRIPCFNNSCIPFIREHSQFPKARSKIEQGNIEPVLEFYFTLFRHSFGWNHNLEASSSQAVVQIQKSVLLLDPSKKKLVKKSSKLKFM